jgi:predicted dienelactone hydrolase
VAEKLMAHARTGSGVSVGNGKLDAAFRARAFKKRTHAGVGSKGHFIDAAITIIAFICALLMTCPAQADALTKPDQPGAFATRTIEFPDLVDTTRNMRRVPIKVHVPQQDGKYPVVVLSHGGGGFWDANLAQARHLASHGYVVLALEHVGSNTERMKEKFQFEKNLRAMTRNSVEVLTRPKDVSFALDRAEEWNRHHPVLKRKLDLTRIGMLGHSFGAYTTLVTCGARVALDWLTPAVALGKGLGPDLSDARVKACVALSPQGPGEPFFLETSFATINRPVLGITGSEDKAQDLSPENRRRFFALIPAGDKIFLWLANADHNGFSDSTGSGKLKLPSKSRDDVQAIVRAVTLLFFESHLRGSKDADNALSAEALKPLLHGVVNDLELQRK